MSTLRALSIISYDSIKRREDTAMITDNERSKTVEYNNLCKLKLILLMKRRHDDVKVRMSYTLIYKV